MNRRSLAAAMIGAMVLTGAAVTITAQPPQGGPGAGRAGRMGPGGPGGFGLHGLGELDLSDTQKEQIRTITQSHRDEIRQAGERVREAQRALDTSTESGTVNEADIRSKSTALAAALAEGAIVRAKVNAEILGVLTAEQQQKLREFQTQRQERRREIRK
jgi:Spy/CpxP family protein refolding chaperone